MARQRRNFRRNRTTGKFFLPSDVKFFMPSMAYAIGMAIEEFSARYITQMTPTITLWEQCRKCVSASLPIASFDARASCPQETSLWASEASCAAGGCL